MNGLKRSIALLALSAASLGCGSAAATAIVDTRSVTLYEPSGAVWITQDSTMLRDRIQLAKNTGFNAVWLILEWDKLDPTPSATGEIPLKDCSGSANYAQYQCGVERAFGEVRNAGVDVFLSLNYAGADSAQSFKDNSPGQALPYGDGPQKFYRYARYVARLAARDGIAYNARFLFHDEGILSPYASLQTNPDAQQRFRDYLYGLNPNLSFWNSRWGRSGTTAFASWADVKTFAFESRPATDPQLQDHVAWVNWTLQRTLANGDFENTIRQIIPGAGVGMHATYFSMINPNGPSTYRPSTPFGANSHFDFASVPYYEGPNSFGLTFDSYVDNARGFFPGRPLMFGELGSAYCQYAGDCTVTNNVFTTNHWVKRRQADFLSSATASLRAKGIGFNVWSLNEFAFPTREGSFGIYEATPNSANTAAAPKFKPAACALSASLPGASPALCVSSGAVNNQYSPRAIWLNGRGFASGAVARLSNAAGTSYAGTNVGLTVGAATSVSFQLSDDVFTQLGCGPLSSGCAIGIEVVNPNSASSNRYIVPVN